MSEEKQGPIVGTSGVKYGLQIRQPPFAKQQHRPSHAAHPQAGIRSNVFGDDSDEEDVESQVARQAEKKKSAAKVSAQYEAALAEDAGVFDYDSVYDSMQEKKVQPRQQEKLERKSRYIAQLKEQAEERKRENDIAFERKTIKDRVKEDHLWEDKEVFVTQAYKKKLEEQQLWQEQQRRKEEEEKRHDVRNLGHMANFYANLNKNVAYGNSSSSAPQAAAGAPSDVPASISDQRPSEDPARPTLMEAAKKVGIVDKYELIRLEAERAMKEQKERKAGEKEELHQHRRADREEDADPKAAEEAKQQDAKYQPPASEPNAGAVKRRNDDTSVQSARDRYLARKKQHV
jgi:coiled-coil domain-containing protein 55